MINKLLKGVFGILMGCLVGLAVIYVLESPTEEVPSFKVNVPAVSVMAEHSMETEEETGIVLSEEEKDLLVRCVFAEAGNQGIEGMRLVASVVLNRVDHPDFPDNVTEVIKANGQFSVWPRAINKVTPSEESLQAVEQELKERTNTDVLYFRTKRYHSFGSPILQHNDHYFSGK